MKPLGDYVLIRKNNVGENMLPSGIILTKAAQGEEGATEGTVESFGPEVKGLTIGDKVFFNEHQFDLLKSSTTYNILVGKKTSIYATYAD